MTYVINLKGEKEPFSLQKVYRSAKRAGASPQVARDIAKTLQKEAYPGTKTSAIFKRVGSLLRHKTPQAALKFNLKQGIKKLGPTGFPFEQYVGEVFRGQGFEVKLNRYLPARCVRNYEIDFVARKGKLIYVGECKYRNRSGDRVHSCDALANYARFQDVLAGPEFKDKRCTVKSLLVTNTKFTRKAQDYSSCVGVELLGWRHPKDKGLERLIEEKGLYPITILPSFKESAREFFSSEGMLLAKDLLKVDIRKIKGWPRPVQDRFQSLLKEARILLENNA